MRITLTPIVVRDSYTTPVEKEIVTYFEETLFDPLRDVVAGAGVRLNEARDERHSAIWDALLAGLIWYAHGVFSGVFNAAISRGLRAIGAMKRGDGFALAQEDIPLPLKGAVALSLQRSAALHEEVLSTLSRIEENLTAAPTGLNFTKAVDKITNDLQEQLVRSVSSVEGLPAPSPVSEGVTGQLREKLTQETSRAVKDFTLEATQELRSLVRQNLSEGGRTDRLASIIEARFGVAQRKAQFLANQETSLLVSGYREQRYRELGSTEYVWETVGDGKVRPTHGESNDHRSLNGRRFSWDAPPVVDSASGRRCHPGQDYNCRCIARPILVFA